MYYFKTLSFRVIILVGFLLSCLAGEAQVKKAFAIRDQRTLRGDMTMIANGIVNKYQAPKTEQVWVGGWWGHYETVTTPEIPTSTPYDGSSNNDNFTMRYIDVDTDPLTFSSSKATLAVPDAPACSKVVYAALYWSGTYLYNGNDSSTGRESTTFHQVKLKLPTQAAYTDITGTVIYDDETSGSATFANRPYACYADVTSLLAGLANPNGEYTVANIRATQASLTGGISAGWTLYVVYENPKSAGRYITSYDGFAGVSQSQAGVDLNYTGFVTVPQKVQAKLIVSALEGDRGIPGDNLKFRSGPTGPFNDISNAQNAADNFFNGTVSVLNALGTSVNFDARVPNSLNTLGYDSDIVNISSQLQPSATEATLRITSTGDTYYMFFNAFSVDVIAPDLQLVKTVERFGQDAAGANVDLGDPLDYILTFKNIGNDDGKDLVITDILPKNTIYVGSTRPTGVAAPTVNPVTGALEFTIPNALVKKGTESIESVIRIHVKVASTCSEFTDACSNEIRNKAFASYSGVINTMPIIDGSVTGLDQNNCMKPIEGPANFIVGLATCDFLHNEVLCGPSLLLKTGSGYATYQWYRKDPAGDIALPGETGQQMTVFVPGEYYVRCIPAAPCLTELLETFIVKLHANSLQNNPIKPFQDKEVKCNDTGEILPVIILCGLNDHKMIQTGITGVTSIVWEKLTGACYDPTAVCINKSATCTWVNVGAGPDYDANEAGTFRMRISYAGGTGCVTSYYFKVSKNLLNPQINTTNIFCTQDGEIKVVNVPTTYEIKLINQTTGTTIVDYPNTNQVFSIATPGVYRIELRHQGVADGCEFILPNIGISKKELEVEFVTENQTCNGLGSIRIKPTDVQSQYQYTISGPVNDTRAPSTNRNVIFEGLISGVYTVTVTTTNGCTITDTVTILDHSNLSVSGTVTQNISCVPGTIKLTGSGGEPTYLYAVHSYTGPAVTPPALNVFSDAAVFEIPEAQAGTYVFAMKDANGCTALTAPITISVMPGVVYTTAFKNVSCNGANDGSITYTVTAANGYTVSYELLDVNGVVLETNTLGKFINLAAGTYTVNLLQTGTGNIPCPFPSTFTISEPAALAGTASLTQAYTCTANGVITVDVPSVTGGTSPYQYSIGGAFSATSTFTGLTPGNYTVKVKDAKGCILTMPVINIPVLPKMTDLTFTPTAVICPTVTANVTVAVTGGVGPFQYAITAPASAVTPVGASATFAGLAPGTYTFTATDANNCTFSKDYTINTITKINVTGALVKSVVCFGEANGSLKYTVSGSTNYNYSVVSSGTAIAPAINQSAPVININNLLAGTYTITVKDNVTNCEFSDTVIIDAPTAALTVSHAVVEPSCTAPGSITVTAANGWGNYMYQLNAGTPQSSNVFNNVAAGTYTITVVDANGCVKTDTATLTTPLAPVINITGSDLCFDADGTTITVNATGGRLPFSYILNSGAGQAGNTFTDLIPGTYNVMVKDANNCLTAPLNFTIYPALKLDVAQKELDCSPSPDAQINITITGGKAPFTYETKIGSNPYGSSATVAASTVSYSTAAAGIYKFRITDAAGCSMETNEIEVLPLSMPAITSLTPTAVVCHGESNGSIAVVVNTAVGTPAYTITVENTTTGDNFTRTTNLPAGMYTVTVTDGKGCTVTDTTEIKEPAAITFTTLETPIQCTVVDPLDPTVNITAGKIRVQNVAGGFEPVPGTPGPYTYYLKNNFGYEATPVTTSNTFHEFIVLNFGIYEVTVEDANGCKVIKSNIIMASPPEEMDIDIAAVVADCATGGTAVVEVKPDVSSDNYSFAILTTNDPNNIPASDYLPADAGTPKIHTFHNLIPGLTYTFIVKDNATGCYYIKTADIPIPTLSNLAIVKDIVTNVTCTNADDGTAKFTFSGFDAGATDISYEVYYAQSNIPVTPIVPPALPPSVPVAAGEVSVSGLAPGIYFILFKEIGGIHDGCSVVSEQFTISESLKLLVPSAVVTKNDNCNTKAGIITASANHGTGPYTYELKLATDAAPTAATWAGTNVNTFDADGGNYIVYVKDANNCIKPAAITLPTDPTPIITTTVTNQCNTAEGAFTISVNMTQAGMPPYTYSIDGGAFVSQATMPFTYMNVSSGDHIVTVKDVNGCTFSPVAPAKIYAPLDLTTVVTAQPWCAISNGEIKITGFGGSGSYRYELKNAADVTIAGPQILNTFGGMAPGTYKVIIRDFNTGCFKEGSITLETPTPVTFNAAKQDVSCKGGNDGAITITLPSSNDNPQYTYLVSKGGVAVTQSGPIFTGLTEGVYDIRVLSGRVCDALGTVTISAPNALTVTATATAFACNPDNTVNTSLVTITEAGGVAPYWYSINGTDYFETNTFDVIDNGAVQNITAHVKDKNNCESTIPVIINPLPALGTAIATKVTGITCTNDETVKIDVTGGSGNFKFELLPAGTTVSPGAGIRTANFTLAAVGSYTFKVTDITTGCSIITLPYEILPYNTITAAVSNAVPVVCFGASNGKITLTVADYTGTYSYKVFNDLGTQVGTGISTAPNTFEITGLPAGVLHVEVKATQTPFCTINTTTITVPSPADALVVNATANASVTCDNNKGVIIAESTGGWGTYEYEFINATTSTQLQPYGVNNLWEDLAAGTYTINVKDAGGCVATTNVTLNPAVRIVADILANPALLACNGDNNATVKATNVANGSGVYQYILNEYDSLTAVTPVSSSGAQLNDTFTGLGAGIYSITVTDGWNCNVETVKVTIDEPEILRGALSVAKQLECIAKAELTLTVTGGTQPYSYKSISDAVYTTMGASDTVTISNLSDGIYQYNIIDANGCAMVMSNQITLEPVPTLELEVTNTIVNCSGATTAEIKGEATGGLGSYKYALLADATGTVELVGDQDSEVFSGLGHGTYYVRVKSKDCSVTSAAITITDPDLLEVTYDLYPVKCFGETTGRIVIHTTGGTGIIQYAISPDLSQFENNNELTGLKAGLYTVLVQDANGCFVLLRDLEITQPQLVEADIDMTATNGERCLGANDGAIAIDIRGGMGVYLVSIEHSAGASTPTAPFIPITGSHYVFEYLTPGDKTIFIKDTNGCAVDPPLEFTITEGVDIKPTTAVTQVCTGNTPSSTLVISIDAAITATDVEYSIDGTNYQASNTFTNVAPGIDKIAYAKHVNGCVQQALYTIETLTPITATAVPTAVLCKSGATGKITVTASGGTGTLEYSISDAVPPVFAAYDTNNAFTGLVKGTYAVSVKDSIGCELQIIDIIVGEPVDVLTATAVPTHEICINAADGTILVTPAGGTGPYFISLNGAAEVNAAVSHNFIDLADGTYTIDVRDTNNCTITQQTVTIDPGVDIQAVATPVETCTGNVPSTVVTVTVNAAVGADVQYSFDGAAYTTTNTFTYANTAGGAKTVDVKHTNGCIQTVPFTINNLTPITANAATTQDVLCNAGTTGEVTVTATAGTGTLQYAISSATPPVFTAYDTNNVFTGLTAGTYTVSVKDGIGCEVVIPGVIVNEPALALSFTAVPTHEICINAADGTILVTPAGGTGPYFISLNGAAEVNAAVSHTFIDLADGTYTIDVRDTNNCTITQQTVIIDPGVDIQAVATPVETCTGNLPSTVVTVTVNAAVAADVQFSFDGGAYGASNTFTYANTAGGAKTVDVKHTNGCIQTVPFTINNLTPITANAATTQDVLCNAGTTGEVTVTATAGTGTLQYAISSATPPVFTAYDTNNVFTGLTAGTYTVSVKDGIGCEVIITGVIVNEPALALSATAVPTHEICINAADGTILVTPAGGTGPYFISLNGAAEVNAAVSHTFIDLADGTYTIDVRDTNNCTITQQTVTINPGVDLQIVATPVETCTGNLPSTVVTVTVNAAVGADVQYSFDGGAFGLSNSFTYANTAGGLKTVGVLHTNGCLQRVSYTINNLTPITANAATTQDVLCNAGATGEVTVTATAGTGTLQYAISSATPPVFTAYDTNNVFTGLTAGTYTVSVKDGIGCEVVIPGVIVNEPALALSFTAVPTHEICINAADGTILVTPAGGTGPYFISLNGAAEVNAAVSHTFIDLADGTYTIDVRDTNNCTITQQTVTINPGVDLQIVATPVETCTGNLPSTVVTVTVNAAVAADVQYSFDGGAFGLSNSFTYANTAGGLKTVGVQHTNGCLERVSYTINNLTPITATVATTQDVLCNAGATGIVTVTATDGTGTLEYAISNAVPPVFAAYNTNNVFTGLTAGTYTVSVKDGIGCEVVIPGVIVDEPALALSATAVPTHEICINAADGTILVTPAGGTGPYFISLNGAAEVNAAVSHTFIDLADGTYTIDVRDTNNCTITQQTVIIDPGVDIQAVATPVETCTGNLPSTVVTVTVNAAVVADVQYSFDGGAYGASNTFTYANTAGGAKTVDVKHTNGCIQTVPFTINNLTPITANAATTQDVLCNAGTTGEVTVTATAGTGTLQYAISSATPPVFTAYDTNNVFTGLTAGTYTVSVKDGIGCEVVIPGVIVNEPALALSATAVPTHEICINANDGTIEVTPAGGTGPYFISLNGATEVNAAVSHTFIDLADGTYTIDVRDTNNCTITQQTVTINPGVDLQIVATPVETCTGNLPSTVVTVTVNAAVAADVQYSFDGGAYSASNSFTYANTAGGAKTVEVKHTNGCIQTVPFTINNLTPITANAATTQDVLCNAGTTGIVTVTAADGTGTLEYAISNAVPPVFGAYNTNNVFTGLTAGTYTVSVKDGIGCEVIITGVIVDEPALALSATAVPTHEICINANDGTIEVTPAGGTGPYFISLNGATEVNAAVSHTFIDLADGTYTIDVRDTNNCVTTQQSVTINAGVDIQAVAAPVETCTGNVPSTVVTVTVNAAVAADVQYSFDGGAYSASNTFTYANTAGGAKTVSVKHTNGCIQTVPFTINNLTPIGGTASATANVLCFGSTTGEVTVAATGGTGALQYAISPNNVYQPSNVFTGLVAGTYAVKVKDAIGCEFVINTILVDGPTAAIAATAAATPETCINVNDGTITITPSGGTAPYFTSIDGVAYTQDKVLYTGLADGTYTVYVKDVNNCAVAPQTVTVIPGVAIQPTVTVSRVCDLSTVTISVNPAVAGNVTYYIDSVLTSNPVTKVFTPGVHTVDVEHVNGCIERTTFTIDPIVPITIGTPILHDIACYGMSTGSIEVIATGGNGPLQYALYHLSDYQNGGPALYPYSTANTFVVPVGLYVAKVRDAIGCETVSQNMEIKEPLAPLSATVTTVPETCVLAKDGQVQITNISGGTPPYSIALNTQTENNFIQIQGNSHVFTGLYGGNYDVFIRDANGCYMPKFTRTVRNGVNIQPYTTTDVICNNNVQTTTVTVHVNPTITNEVTFSETGNPGTYTANNVFSYTTAGERTVYILHVNGCKGTVKFTIAPRVAIVPTAAVTEVLCKGEANGSITVSATGGIGTLQYGISPNFTMGSNPVFNGLAAGDHIIRVEDSIGCYTDLTVNVKEPLTALAVKLEKIWQEEICVDDDNGALEVSVSGGAAPYFTSLDANGVFTEGEYLFDNLDGGVTYTVYVKDANGCITSIDVPLAAPITINAKEEIVYECEGNKVRITTTDVFVPSDLTHSLNGGAPQMSNEFEDLPNGTHTVDILHASGCSDSVTFKIDNPLPLTIIVAESGFNQITATASGGKGSYSYTYTLNGDVVSTNRSYTYFKSGKYVVTVTDNRGCEAIAEINVVFVEINIPDIVTPDNDGHNDGWKPNNTQNYPKLTADVFDRYGRKLASLREGQAWDCKYEGNEMPSGDYWYLVKLNADQDSREFIGHFTIYR